MQLIAPNHEPEFEFGAFKGGTHPTGSVICNVIGAFKGGTHPTGSVICNVIGAFKNGTHPTGSAICNVIGAFKGGTHPTGSVIAMLSVRSKTERSLRGSGGFPSQILLSPDLTYRGLLVNMVLIVGQELFNVENM